MKTSNELKKLLYDIDHRGYPAYKQTAGQYGFDGYVLSIDHVQGDPFASPSKVSIKVKGNRAGFPEDYYKEDQRRIALQDLLTRRFYSCTLSLKKKDNGRSGSGKSGLISSSRPGQEILERSCCVIDRATGDITFRLEVGFPAFGRSINSKELIYMLFDLMPDYVEGAFYYHNNEEKKYREVLELADDQLAIRNKLDELGLCAFIADGAVLPRQSGVSDRPMKEAVPFKSPDSLKLSLELPHAGRITGMGIRKGITLIVGGGYHGKSTLLKALERGVYDHIKGDGREYVITERSAVKIRSEDGRCVHGEDISMFINDLPDGRDAKHFYTEDASGSTSQAANVIEAIECGSRTLLIDEDTCATNFMVRDELMQRVIKKEQEPITPFIERMEQLYKELGISCILVAGSSGAFFRIADTVVQIDRYIPYDITERAKEEYSKLMKDALISVKDTCVPEVRRIPSDVRTVKKGDRIKTKTHGRDGFSINREEVDIRYLEQITDTEQTSALAQIVRIAVCELIDGKRSFNEIIDIIEERLDNKGVEVLCGSMPYCGLARPRRQEIAGTLNRCRFMEIKKPAH
ncbi:MAG: ABC-ATPase domain-containing protein [Lachnospiraceae bacterium]|nr:ABC-ATPase domain-containing protein [Lachnospiraceae bacterium]